LDESICDSSSNMASIDTNPKSSSSTTHLHLYNLRWRSSRLSASSSTTSLDSLAKEKVAYHDDEAGGQKKLKPIESALAHKRATSTISPQSLIRSSASLVLREPPGIPPGKVLSATFTMIKVVKWMSGTEVGLKPLKWGILLNPDVMRNPLISSSFTIFSSLRTLPPSLIVPVLGFFSSYSRLSGVTRKTTTHLSTPRQSR
jgi:hypothetical protein